MQYHPIQHHNACLNPKVILANERNSLAWIQSDPEARFRIGQNVGRCGSP